MILSKIIQRILSLYVDTAGRLVHGVKQGADSLVGGVLNGVGNAYDNVRDAVADGVVGKRVESRHIILS